MRKCLEVLTTIVVVAMLASCSLTPSNGIQSIITELTGEKYEGRLVGTAGNEKASEFIAGYMKANGLSPLFGESYYQEYDQQIAVPSSQNPEITITNQDGSQMKLEYGNDYIINAVADNIDVDMPISFGLDEKNLDSTIPIIPSEQRASKPKECKIVFVSYSAIRFAPAIPQSGDCLTVYITNAVKEKMEKTVAVRAQIKCSAAVSDYRARNVVAVIAGKDREKAVVLTAHFDHIGKQGVRMFPGALDNASGTAALLSAAIKMKASLGDNLPDTDIVFACVNSEECSGRNAMFQGSTALVTELSRRYSGMFNINIDCIGGKNAGPLAMGAVDPNAAELAQAMCKLLDQKSVKYTDASYEAGSDHQIFLSQGYGAMVIGQTEIIHATHIESDTIASLDIDEIDRISSAISEFVLGHNNELFLAHGEEQGQPDEYFDSIQWWKDAMGERDKILNGRVLAYDEGIEFLFDDTVLRATGYRPLTSLKEVSQYYSQMKIADRWGDYLFDNVTILDGALLPISRSEVNAKSETKINEIFSIPLKLEDAYGLALEYRKADVFLQVQICKPHMTSSLSYGVVREPLGQEHPGYSLNHMEGVDGKYHGFTYHTAQWDYSVSVFHKIEAKDIYSDVKVLLVPDVSKDLKTKQEMLDFIASLGIDGKAEQLITDLGLK